MAGAKSVAPCGGFKCKWHVSGPYWSFKVIVGQGWKSLMSSWNDSDLINRRNLTKTYSKSCFIS